MNNYEEYQQSETDDDDDDAHNTSGEAEDLTQTSINGDTPQRLIKDIINQLEKAGKLVLKPVDFSNDPRWGRFSVAFRGEEKLPAVVCKACAKSYVYRGRSTGTTSIFKHECSKKASSHASSSQASSSQASSSNTTIPTLGNKPPTLKSTLKRRLIEAVTFACVNDKLPYMCAERPGLHALVAEVVNIGYHHGPFDVATSLPCGVTVSREVKKLAKIIAAETKSKLQGVVFPAFAIDHYTDPFNQRVYQALNVRYIDAEFTQLNEHALHCAEYTEADSRAPSLAKAYDDTMQYFGLPSDVVKSSYCTSDQCRALMKAVQSQAHHISCGCHILATVLRNVLDAIKLLASDAVLNLAGNPGAFIVDIFKRCDRLVKFAKNVGFNKSLPISLKHYPISRWSYRYIMLKTILDSYDTLVSEFGPRISEFFDETIDGEKQPKVTKHVLKNLVDVLHEIKLHIEMLESDGVNFHLVAPVIFGLREKMLPKLHADGADTEDPSYIKLIKKRMNFYIDTKAIPILTDMHYAASELSPEFKDLWFIPADHNGYKYKPNAKDYKKVDEAARKKNKKKGKFFYDQSYW